jgi:hypothetical protein
MEEMQNEFNQGTNEKASVTPLVLGILSFAGLIIPLVGYILGIAGLVTSNKDLQKPNSKFGKAGKILSIIGLVVSAINHVLAVILASSL